MKRQAEQWPISTLRDLIGLISYPEYQREPNLWSRTEKQRLIDSIVREFDIASIYLYRHSDEDIDCVDGRQRIGAIMSFLGENEGDGDNGFPYRTLNEIEPEGPVATGFQAFDGLTFAQIEESTDAEAQRFVKQFHQYELTVVELTDSRAPNEFNLQFTRLNLGTIINSGEKLNAMFGELRDACYGTDGLGAHPFLRALGVPTRRYASEQLAAQMLAQMMSQAKTGEYTRTRHFDLQRLFKQGTRLDTKERGVVERARGLLDVLHDGFNDPAVLRNRAIAVSAVMLAWDLSIETTSDARMLAAFVEELLHRLRWQITKGLDVDPEYRYLVDFQRDITQASVEKPAVQRRAAVMKEQYEGWLDGGGLRGDDEWKARHPGEQLGEG